MCPINATRVKIPYAVSVVSELDATPVNMLLVRNTDDDPALDNGKLITNIPDRFAVCIQPTSIYDSVNIRSNKNIKLNEEHSKLILIYNFLIL